MTDKHPKLDIAIFLRLKYTDVNHDLKKAAKSGDDKHHDALNSKVQKKREACQGEKQRNR